MSPGRVRTLYFGHNSIIMNIPLMKSNASKPKKSYWKQSLVVLFIFAVAAVLVFSPGGGKPAYAVFPTNATVLDNFNRADGAISGSTASSGVTWSTGGIDGNVNGLNICGNQLCGINTNGVLTPSYGPDTEIYADMPALPLTSDGGYVFMAERISNVGTSGWNGYGMLFAPSNTWQLRRYTGGSSTVLASGTQAATAGDSLGFSVIGNTLTAWYKPAAGAWTSVVSTTDSTYSSAGPVGIELGDSTVRLDNLAGGSTVTNVPPAAPTLSIPTDGDTGTSTTPQFQLRTTDADNDYLRYKIEVCSVADCSAVVRTIDQTISQTGWSGQDLQSGTAYTSNAVMSSSTMAAYTYQAPALSPATQYWWRAYAIDPGGTNTFSSASAIQTFTTAASPTNNPSNAAPGGTAASSRAAAGGLPNFAGK